MTVTKIAPKRSAPTNGSSAKSTATRSKLKARAQNPLLRLVANEKDVVYLSRPSATFNTSRGEMLSDTVRLELEGCEVLDVRDHYGNYQAWLSCLTEAQGLVIFGDEEGALDVRGLYELTSVLRIGLPVAVMGEDLRLHNLDAIRLVAPLERTTRRTAVLVPGDIVSPEFPGTMPFAIDLSVPPPWPQCNAD